MIMKYVECWWAVIGVLRQNSVISILDGDLSKLSDTVNIYLKPIKLQIFEFLNLIYTILKHLVKYQITKYIISKRFGQSMENEKRPIAGR